MNTNAEYKQSINTYHLQQHEMVNFLYDRFTIGMIFTLIVAMVATVLSAYELELQGRQNGVFLWLVVLLVIQFFRWSTKKAYDRIKDDEYLSHQYWKKKFIVGVYIIALWQGVGAVLVMPYISVNLQIIFHAFLLGMGAGAIAYLATSMTIYVSYLVLMIMPITLYLFWVGTPDSMVLGFMHVFMIVAYYFGVRRMNIMITESLNLRFDNEMLVNDLQRLLSAVAESNKELDTFSTTDELTGASNFRAFRVRLEEHRRKHITTKLPLTLIMINIDYYHEYNVHYGQEAGNKTLCSIAQLLMDDIIQEDEIVARIYGAEFGVLLPSVSCEGARIMMEKVMLMLEELGIKNKKSKISPLLTLSAGICCVPVNEKMNARDLISRAEEALRQAKKNGRNRIEIVNT